MAIPYSAYVKLTPAALTATANITIIDDIAEHSAQVEIVHDLAGFSGTIKYQGNLDSTTWIDLPYVVNADGFLTPTTAAASYTTSTSTPLHIILTPMPHMRVVMTRSAGTLNSTWARGYSEGFRTPISSAGGPPPSVATAASSVYDPVTSVVTAAFIKASAGNIFRVTATNANVAARWLQMHNKATIPLATEVPQRSWEIPAGTANNPGWIDEELSYPEAFATGIGFAISTTQGTFTDSATAAEHTKRVEYA